MANSPSGQVPAIEAQAAPPHLGGIRASVEERAAGPGPVVWSGAMIQPFDWALRLQSSARGHE